MKRCFLSLHKFSEWRYLGSTSCGKERTCKRCGKEQIRKFPKGHKWRNSHPNHPCSLSRDCKNCGYKDFRPPQHEFGPDEYPNNRCYSSKKCTKCGRVEQTSKHIGEWKLIGKERIADRINAIYADDLSVYQCTVCGEKRRTPPV